MAEMYRVARILVPIDGSECSHYAAEYAILMAQPHGAEVVFLHVIDEEIAAELSHEESFDGEEGTRERLFEQGQAYLRHESRLAGERGVAHRELLVRGDPCAAICDTAVREGVDVIVVGKLGRRGARRILMGSITRRVIEASDRPVLVVTGPPAKGVFGPT